ncbi:formylglycine-generating enzyme family protein [Nocardioidaceae bacterium SCSIO 66511]|nr:formylglycine-generating enzyme family protein [Nocardioidaceae bacterium SCSIO 66511]
MTETTTRTHRKGTAAMKRVSGGTLLQGSEDFYPEEQPVREVEVAAIWVDEHPVTNAEFRRFVKDTGHVTIAERDPDPADFPDAKPEQLVAGSLVFTATEGPVPLDNWHQWWRWQPGADWRHPEGPESTLHGRDKHPVVHIAYEDAKTYAAWAGKRLATESEWEWAARGGLVGKSYVWGDEFMPKNRVMANTWHGEFPWRNDRAGKHALTSPIGSYPPNGYGLFDMAGNVWEWTDSPWTFSHADEHVVESSSCCAPSHLADESNRMVSKGGSHLCAPSYCHRYRPAARQGHAIKSSTSHLGFRCVVSAD